MVKRGFGGASRLRSKYIRDGNITGLQALSKVQNQIDDALYDKLNLSRSMCSSQVRIRKSD